MKTMILSDLIIMRDSLLQLLGICVVVGAVLSAAMESVVSMAAMLTVMLPFLYLTSVSAYDEMGRWELFRLTLPLSRRQVVMGRYASLLVVTAGAAAFALVLSAVVLAVCAAVLGDAAPAGLTLAENAPFALVGSTALSACVLLLASAVALPLIMRFGMTRWTRLAPVAVVLVLAAGVWLLGDGMPASGALDGVVAWLEAGDGANLALACGIVLVAALALYAASSLLATRLYEAREL
ncbi:MAG: ABC-2 transporter permease [Eggerthellaceae bacterium]|nr:ABC-2 transporter permease [Eggerthellaceae bacterium]